MKDSSPTTISPALRIGKFLWRIATIVCAATIVGWILNQLTISLNTSGQLAGFWHGVVQGAMMPCAMPNLLFGNDVTIYASYNTGLTYKLGYTVGVNICGALFFGLSFWRLRKWRRQFLNTSASTQ